MHTEAGCPFCKRIAAGEYDTPRLARGGGVGVVSFEPLNPVTPGHRLFVPTAHLIDAAQRPLVTGVVFASAAQFAADQPGRPEFNLVTSAGAAATQTVLHLHVHYVPRREGDELALPWTGQRS